MTNTMAPINTVPQWITFYTWALHYLETLNNLEDCPGILKFRKFIAAARNHFTGLSSSRSSRRQSKTSPQSRPDGSMPGSWQPCDKADTRQSCPQQATICKARSPTPYRHKKENNSVHLDTLEAQSKKPSNPIPQADEHPNPIFIEDNYPIPQADEHPHPIFIEDNYPILQANGHPHPTFIEDSYNSDNSITTSAQDQECHTDYELDTTYYSQDASVPDEKSIMGPLVPTNTN